MKDAPYVIAINPNYNENQKGLASMEYKFFNIKTGLGVNVNEVAPPQLNKSVIKNLKRRKVHVKFKYIGCAEQI